MDHVFSLLVTARGERGEARAVFNAALWSSSSITISSAVKAAVAAAAPLVSCLVLLPPVPPTVNGKYRRFVRLDLVVVWRGVVDD